MQKNKPFKKLIVAQMLKKFPAFIEPEVYIRLILVLFSYLPLDVLSELILSDILLYMMVLILLDEVYI